MSLSPSTSTTSIATATKSTTTKSTTTAAYRNFIHSLKSPKTRFEYIRSLRYYMAWLKLDVLSDNGSSSYDKLLQKDPKLITSDIIEFIIYLKDKKKLSPATVTTYISAIRHFYDMNDIDQLKWKKIQARLRGNNGVRIEILQGYRAGKYLLLCCNCNRLESHKQVRSEPYIQQALIRLNKLNTNDSVENIIENSHDSIWQIIILNIVICLMYLFILVWFYRYTKFDVL